MFRIIPSKFFSTTKASIQAIKKLRQLTSAPISQCKTALEQNNCNQQQALTWLKKKGILQAQKRLNQQVKQGVMGAIVTPCRTKAALVQVNCQTDFVSKNSLFLTFANNLLTKALQSPTLLSLDKQDDNSKKGISNFLQLTPKTSLFPQDTSIKNLQQQYKILISRVQQNINIRRLITLHSDKNKFGIYLHQQAFNNIGKQASIVQLKTQPQLDLQNHQQFKKFTTFADNIAVQLLGSPPKYYRQQQIKKQTIDQQIQKIKLLMKQKLQKTLPQYHQKAIYGKLNAIFYSQYLLPKMNYILSNDGITVQSYWNQQENQIGKKFYIANAYIWNSK